MLSKEICERCKKNDSDVKWKAWTGKTWFDNFWDVKGMVSCHWYTHSIKGDPPEYCPYALEHLLKAQKHVK